MEDLWEFSWLTLFGVFAFQTLILHLVFVWLFPQKDSFWKAVDYIWLLLTISGIFFAADNARSYMLQIRAEQNQASADFFSRDLKELLKRTDDYICRINFQQVSDPTPDVALFTEHRKLACSWLQQASSIILEHLSRPSRSSEQLRLPDDSAVTHRWSREGIDDIRATVSDYETAVQLLAKSQDELKTLGKPFMVVLIPYLLALAFSIRTTKVTADVLAARKKEKLGRA